MQEFSWEFPVELAILYANRPAETRESRVEGAPALNPGGSQMCHAARPRHASRLDHESARPARVGTLGGTRVWTSKERAAPRFARQGLAWHASQYFSRR